MPSLRAPRASKGNPSDPPTNPLDLMQSSSSGTRQMTFKTSLDELRNPASKLSLRQHLTNAFPEAQQRPDPDRTPSFESNESADMGVRDRMSRQNSSLTVGTVGQNEAAQSSSSTVNSTAKQKRLTTVQEMDPKIDIEQAIHLLQELKKTASPQELVALHKALLPTRDSALPPPSPSLPVIDHSADASSPSLIRHRSLFPPGLATRASHSEDILRRQEDVPKATKKAKKTRFPVLKEATSHSDIAALDLADEPVQPRAATPADDLETPLGSYRYGTLRITNGAASPVPSLASLAASAMKNVEVPAPVTAPEKNLGSRDASKPALHQADGQDYFTAPNTPLEGTHREAQNLHVGTRHSTGIFDTFRSKPANPRRQSDVERRPRERTRTDRPRSKSRDASVSGIPMPTDPDESAPRIYKPTRPRRSRDAGRSSAPQSREPSQHRTARSRESSLSRIPLRAETSKPNLQQRVSTQSLTPVSGAIDDGRISPLPTDMPRFAQRLSHRASKLAEDYTSGSDASATPSPLDITRLRQYEDGSAFLKRLSTVYDGEGDDDNAAATETPEGALSRLNGIEGGSNADLTIQTHLTTLNEKPSRSPQSGNATNNERTPPGRQADSGYGTDTSFQGTVRPKKSVDQPRGTRLFLVPDEGDQGDAASLYSFNQILKSPSLLEGFATPSLPPAASGKKASFFSLASKKSSPNVAVESADEAATPTSEVRSARSKKLQKPMPEAVRQERKAKIKKAREDKRDGEAPEVTVDDSKHEIPAVPPEMCSTSRARFSFDSIPKPVVPLSTTPSVASPNEFVSEVHLTAAELTGDEGFASADEPTAPKRSLFRGHNRRRSNARTRSLSLRASDQDKQVAALGKDNDARRRNSQSGVPTKSSFGVGPISCIGVPGGSDDKGSDIDVPLWTDHASVSRTLGCSPYDLSTGLFRRTVALPSTVMHHIQAPHEITTSMARSKSGGLMGMNSDMASELARMKSRDMAIGNNERLHEQPRMAKPRGRREMARSKSSAPVPPMLDRGTSQASNADTIVNLQLAELPERPNSMYTESIPPMPELPADVQAKVARMDEMAARKIRDSAQPTPPTSAGNGDERPGDSTVSVADAIRRTRSARNSDGTKRSRRPSGPRKKKSQRIDAREISSSGSEGNLKNKQDGRDIPQRSQPTAPESEAQKPQANPFEQQAQYWRERRKSLVESLGRPESKGSHAPEVLTALPQRSTTLSPAIVVSHNDSPTLGSPPKEHLRTHSASLQADAYRALIGEDSDPDPEPRDSSEIVTYATTAATSITLHRPPSHRPATVTVPSRDPIARTRSPGGRVVTPSGNYHPYTPAAAAQAERSRAESLAKLTGQPLPPRLLPKTYAPTNPSRRTRSVQHQPMTQAQAQPRAQPETYVPQQEGQNAVEALFDRYGGGLDYNYERGAGFRGSAGTRGTKDWSGRKSQRLSEGFGVDLSDVPIMLAKVART